MKQFVYIAIIACCSLSFGQNKKWTLKACVDYALEHNITVQRSENQLKINEQDIKAAQGNKLPGVRANISQSLSLGQAELFPGTFVDRTFHGTNASIGVSQTVFDGFRNTYFYKQSQLNFEANNLELSRIKDDISLNVVNAYLNVLFNQENLEIAQAQYDFSLQQLKQVKNLVDAGVQPKANIYDAEATVSSDAQNLTVAENNLNLALLMLSQLLQVPFDGFEVEVTTINNPSEALLYNNVQPVLDMAFQNRNEIKFAEKNVENAELSTKISKGGFLPSLTFGYSFNSAATFSNLSESKSFFQQLNEQKGHSFNLNLSIPIFSRFQNKTAVAKSLIQEENSKLDLEQAKLDLESTIQRAFTDAQAAFKTYQAAKKSLVSQELAFNNATERYNIGAMTTFDLEQARVRLINAQSSLINAKYDFVFKTKVLDFYMGKPIIN
ncbi:TolC family protein [Gaetbulibacter saemankumensis]|uniref:TolC family protein n=1 Tax=Gaetbulibacter saemankumensis TaxID=311208 RepID=UPI000402A732|nr:TolC family protein [Gaetbulibacter saemankumensis]